jgi:hypothetical protein
MNDSSPEYRIAAVFEEIAADTGGSHWRRAAAALKRSPPKTRGPKVIDDSAALSEMRLMIDSGDAVETAARYVATTLTGCQSPEAATRRLARKYRAALNSASN